ncbi:MAG: hypothetical protein R2769_01360 [Saprospiraceae bacterium]
MMLKIWFTSAKLDPEAAITAVHFEGSKGWTMVKRFQIETSSLNQKFNFISDSKGSSLLYVTVEDEPVVEYEVKEEKTRKPNKINLAEFIDVKGWKALGNKLEDSKISKIKPVENDEEEDDEDSDEGGDNPNGPGTPIKPGDTIEFDIDGDGQGSLF